MTDTTIEAPTHGETRVGSDGVTIRCSIAGNLTLWRDPDGELHNPDGPAMTSTDGEQMWCRHGVLDRDGDLPARIDQFGVCEHFTAGVRHRAGGQPAVHGPEKGPWRRTEFWFEGRRDNPNGPAIEGPGGVEFWRDGERHRDSNEPAVKTADGRIEYWRHGLRHRTDGPAVIKPGNGGVEFWLEGVRYLDVWTYREAGGVVPDEPIVRQVDPEPDKPVRKTTRRKAA